MTPRTLLLLLSLSALALAARAHAQSKAAPPHPPITAVRLDAPVSVDGVLNEPVWSSGTPVTEFYQSEPHQGEAARFRTEARVAFDDNAIYVGLRMFDPAPDSIIARLTRRDDSVPTDRVCVYLDPYHDKRSGYYFLINAAGTLLDGTLSNDGWEDGSWDGVWSAQAKRDQQGWTAEMRIPYSQLRFQKS